MAITVAKRQVFHLGGYDPITPHAVAQRRFVRELARFQGTWSVKASVDGLREDADQAKWSVTTTGPNWQVETDYHLVRWDDVIKTLSRRTIFWRIPHGIIAFSDFVASGALWGYVRTNWHYAGFFLYPFVMFGALMLAAYFVGSLAVGSGGPIALIASFFVFVALLVGPWRWLHLSPLFDDWIFAREYVRKGNSVLEQRLDRLATEIVAAASNPRADELLVIGHSLGAVLAIDLLDRALALDPALIRKVPLTLVTIGSSVLKIGLHGGATRFRRSVQRVAQFPGIFWGDYQARVDIMNFYNTNPMAEMALPTEKSPVVKFVEFSKTLDRAMYRHIRLRFFRMHCQFISGNDKRALYDYFMLVCGPVSAKSQTLAADGAVSMIGDDGSLINVPRSYGEPLVRSAR